MPYIWHMELKVLSCRSDIFVQKGNLAPPPTWGTLLAYLIELHPLLTG